MSATLATDTLKRTQAERTAESDMRMLAAAISLLDPDLRDVITKVHERRSTDVANWIRAGIQAGTIKSDVPVEVVAEQFCTSIIGIVYQWLATPEEIEKIHKLHEGLKTQMLMALPAN